MIKSSKMTVKKGYFPPLESKSHTVFFKLWRFEIFIGWNSTFLKLKYIKFFIIPWFDTEKARYGRDVNTGWLGGEIEISYINKAFTNNAGIQKEIPNDERDSDSGISLHCGADLRI